MGKKSQLGERIRLLRDWRKLTQEALADRTGMHAKHISAIENGRINLTVDTIQKIAAGLEVELWEVFSFAGNPGEPTDIQFKTVFGKMTPEKRRAAWTAVCAISEIPG